MVNCHGERGEEGRGGGESSAKIDLFSGEAVRGSELKVSKKMLKTTGNLKVGQKIRKGSGQKWQNAMWGFGRN